MKKGDVGNECNVDERGKRECNFKDNVQSSIQKQVMLIRTRIIYIRIRRNSDVCGLGNESRDLY
jgi:hypothetical protein